MKLFSLMIPSWTDWKLAFKDFILAFKAWRIFCLIGITDIQKRYARSKLGQWWLTLSLAINIAMLSFVWSNLFHIPIKDYVPYITCGLIMWTYISGCITESCQLYVVYSGYVKELNISKLSYCNSLFVKNLVVLAHNIPVLIGVFVVFQHETSLESIWLTFAGLTLTTMFLYGVSLTLAILGLRFRDIANIVQSLMQVMIYITPVLWKLGSMNPDVQNILLTFNPFAIFMIICRDTIIGEAVPTEIWSSAITYTVVALLVAAMMFAKFRRRLPYWL
jgi:ABC-type polysaccharide/polyol phosphate export permease